MKARLVQEEDLQAYVDGRLDRRRARAVQAYLEERAEEAARVADYQADLLLLRQALGVGDERRVEASEARPGVTRHFWSRQWALALAAAGLIAVGAGAGWMANGWLGAESLPPFRQVHWRSIAQEALQAHRTFAPEVRRPVEVTGDSGELASWISRRLGRRLPVPDLSAKGFALVGGRVLPGSTGTAALIMYQDDSGARVTVYIQSAEPGRSAMRFLRTSDLLAFYWVDDDCVYVVTGSLDRAQLGALADATFQQFEEAS